MPAVQAVAHELLLLLHHGGDERVDRALLAELDIERDTLLLFASGACVRARVRLLAVSLASFR